MNVLIVDDDQMICDGTARRLEKSGIQEITDITCAYSAEEALAIFEKKNHTRIVFGHSNEWTYGT